MYGMRLKVAALNFGPHETENRYLLPPKMHLLNPENQTHISAVTALRVRGSTLFHATLGHDTWTYFYIGLRVNEHSCILFLNA